MVGHPAVGVVAAQAGAGVSALLLYAGSGLAALRAHETLGSAVRRLTNHPTLTAADAHTITLSELAVGAARVGVTRVNVLLHHIAAGCEGTLGDGVTSVAQETGADGLMSVGITHSIDAAHSRAWVDTLVAHTGSVGGAVIVGDTLRSAGQVGVTKVARYTGAGACSLLGSTVGIGSTRRWIAGINYLCCPHSGDLRDESALSERVSIIAGGTSADGLVVDHLALSIGATGARAGVNTPLPDTGSVVWTVWVDGTLRPAVGRNSNVVGQTGAGSNSSCQVILTLGEGSTRCRIARINLLNIHRGNGRRWGGALTVAEWISLISRGTLTDGVMVGHLTPGIIATCARAGVHALLVYAGSQLTAV